MEWISVKDKLPKFGEKVLIWFKGNGFSTKEFYTYGIAHLEKEDGEFWNDNDEIAVLEVFAWATLPEPYRENN